MRKQMESLYFGPCRLIRAVVPGMRERRFGVVVNMSSGAGLEGRESMGAYAPAKAALDGKRRIDLYSGSNFLNQNWNIFLDG